MLHKENYTEWIENYLDGELSMEDKIYFEQELQVNKALKELYNTYSLASQVIVDHKLTDIENTLQNVQSEYISKQKQKSRLNKVLIGSALVAGSIGAFVLFSPGESKTEKLKEQPKENTNQKVSESTIDSNSHITFETHTEQPTDVEKIEPTQAPTITTVVDTVEPDTTTTIATRQEIGQGIIHKTSEEKQAKDSSAVEETVAPELKDPCDGFAAKTNFTQSATCKGKEEGEIFVEEISQGKPPFKFILSNGDESFDGEFNNLPAGAYSLKLNDANGCKKTIDNIVIEEKLCKVDLYFAEGESTLFPTSKLRGELTVLDKQSRVSFTHTIEAQEEFEWDGETNNGYLSEGYYLFIIKYTDGSIQQGSLTITP